MNKEITEQLIQDLDSILFDEEILKKYGDNSLIHAVEIDQKIREFDAILKFHNKIYPK